MIGLDTVAIAQDQKPLGYIRRVLALDRHPELWLEPPVPQ